MVKILDSTEKNEIVAGQNSDHNGMRSTTKSLSSRTGADSSCCCSSSCSSSCCCSAQLPAPAPNEHDYDPTSAPRHPPGTASGRGAGAGSPDHCDNDDDGQPAGAAGRSRRPAAAVAAGVLVPSVLDGDDDQHDNPHGNHNDDNQDHYRHQHGYHQHADHDLEEQQEKDTPTALASAGEDDTAGGTGGISSCAPAEEQEEADNEESKNKTKENMNNNKNKNQINPDVMNKTKVDIHGELEDHNKKLILPQDDNNKKLIVPQSSSACIQPAAYSFVRGALTYDNMHKQQEDITNQVGKRNSVLVGNSTLEFLNSKTPKRLKVLSNEFEIIENIGLKQDTSENNTNACNRNEDGCNIELNQVERDPFLSTSTIADCERSVTSLNLTISANSSLQAFRRRTDTTKLSPGLTPPKYPKRRSTTGVFLLPAVLLGSQDENGIPDALTHIPTTEKIDIFNRRTGRIIKGVPIAQVPPLLRDHAEYEPIYFGKVKKQPFSLYRASRTSHSGRVSAEVQPQTTVLCTKNIGDIVLVINGILKGTWGRIVSHIPGNWLIIRRCFSFDGNDNFNIIVHSKNVKLKPKHKDTVIRKGNREKNHVPPKSCNGARNAISPTQNKMSAILEKVSDLEGKIEEMEKTSSDTEICN